MINRKQLAALAVTFTLAASLHAQVGKSVTVIDINTATEAQLTGMPGMSGTLAKAVIAARPFASIVEADALLGKTLSKEQRTALYKFTFVHVNLNTGTTEEIMLIPGMGPKMLKEFQEYKPFSSMAHFTKEMGKYVDAAENARLGQYVFVPVKLNSASDEDILSIPGAGARMLREFKEYRPYPAIDKFRKEIGKYVDPKEVGRLERYVVAQ